jgi:hypothetical protein
MLKYLYFVLREIPQKSTKYDKLPSWIQVEVLTVRNVVEVWR